MKVYLVFADNGENYEDYYEWLDNVYSTRELAKKRIQELKRNIKKNIMNITLELKNTKLLKGGFRYMNIEVGMYVRYSNGINKIIEIKNNDKERDVYHLVLTNDEVVFGSLAINYTIFIKENLIDLIEVGDYVNGKFITSKDETSKRLYSGMLNDYEVIPEECIYSIVTKEQFNNCKYEVQ